MNNPPRRIWLFSKKLDVFTLVIPVLSTWVICFLLPSSVLAAELPLWVWVVIVVGIDVSHVWSTIFRTYLDRDERANQGSLLIKAPLLGFLSCFVIAYYSISLFWTLLAYYALYHFIKQQYGFMQLYRAKYGKTDITQWVSDKMILYIGMGYPVLFWHLNHDRVFAWFVTGDFVQVDIASQYLIYFNTISQIFYFVILVVWLMGEIMAYRRLALKPPIGKWLWILMTAFNWYLGIVYFNSDIAFTLTNVVAHGIPYFMLVGYYVIRKNKISAGHQLSTWGLKYIPVMIGVVLLLSFGEEYLWDMLLYQDNIVFFESVIRYPMQLLESNWAQAIALALLSLPQVTHYILDGYIWKTNKKNPFLKQVFTND